MLFTFRRDADGRETIHVGDVAIARIRHDLPAECDDIEWIASPPAGITAEHVREAAVKADEAGFFAYEADLIVRARKLIQDGDYTAEEMFGVGGWSNVKNEVVVEVPVAETTSTILSLTTEEER